MPKDDPEFKKPPEGDRYLDALAELNRRTEENQANVGSRKDWLRHTWPAITLCAVACLGLLLAVLLVVVDSQNVVLLSLVLPAPMTVLAIMAIGAARRRHHD